MSIRRLHGPPARLRLLALVWLVLCVAAQPLLARLADIHHAVHDVAASQVGHGHDHAAFDAPLPAVADEPDLPSILHDVLHLAHCCGQASVPSAAVIDLPASIPAAAAPSRAPDALRRDAGRGAPYRPPILL